VKVLDDFAVGSTRQGESLRTHWRAAPNLAFSARGSGGSGRHRDAEETVVSSQELGISPGVKTAIDAQNCNSRESLLATMRGNSS